MTLVSRGCVKISRVGSCHDPHTQPNQWYTRYEAITYEGSMELPTLTRLWVTEARRIWRETRRPIGRDRLSRQRRQISPRGRIIFWAPITHSARKRFVTPSRRQIGAFLANFSPTDAIVGRRVCRRARTAALRTFIYLFSTDGTREELIPSENFRVNKTTLTITNPPFINCNDRAPTELPDWSAPPPNLPEAADVAERSWATNTAFSDWRTS